MMSFQRIMYQDDKMGTITIPTNLALMSAQRKFCIQLRKNLSSKKIERILKKQRRARGFRKRNFMGKK